MPAPMLKERTIILAKAETTYGTDAVPTASSNAILTMGTKIKEVHSPITRDLEMQSISQRQSVRGEEYMNISFQTEIIGSGTAGTAPRLGALLKACSMSETISVGSSVIYTPTTSPQTSLTMYIYLDGRRYVVAGCVGTFKLMADAGKQGLLDFSFKGLYAAPTDTALISPTYETTIDTPAIVKSGALTINSVSTLIAQKLELDLANTLAMRPSISAATAINGFYVSNRKPIVTIDPESVPVATYDWRTDILTNPRALSMQIGATAGNICTLNVPKYNVIDIEYAEREKIVVEKIKGECTANSAIGDDELTLKFT